MQILCRRRNPMAIRPVPEGGEHVLRYLDGVILDMAEPAARAVEAALYEAGAIGVGDLREAARRWSSDPQGASR